MCTLQSQSETAFLMIFQSLNHFASYKILIKLGFGLILFFALSECQCNEEGSSSGICDIETGQCPCKSDLITGLKCDESIPGHYDFPDPKRK